jgi:general secretion pathway protein D/MSHA biogenesis protein MshL
MMKSNTRLLHSVFAMTATALLLCSCLGKKSEDENTQTARLAAPERKQRTVIEPSLLPQRFQKAGYMISDDETNAMLDSEASDEFQLKVGADITTREPITLREAMKALVRNKKMSLSWASDVNQDLLVDIDVTAEDNFYEAIDNILRQLDYFHEVQGSTLIIKYRESKQYHIAMPFNKQVYSTSVGSEGLSLVSAGNEYDTWENIEKNIQTIIETWGATVATPEPEVASSSDADKTDASNNPDEKNKPQPQSSRRVSSTESKYTIDRPLGLITIHAPQSLQKRIADYLHRLEKELYKQIIIEAKIIEVQLQDSSSLGINWNTLLKNLSFAGGSLSGVTSYGRDTQENIDNGTDRTNTHSNTNTITNSRSSDNTSGGDRTSSAGGDFTGTTGNTSSSTNDGTATTNNNGSTGSDNLTTTFNGLTSDTNSRTNSNSSSNVNTISDSLNLATTAASTVATIITGGASNIAAAGISLAGFSFDSFINALKTQGKTSVLSNPKISVMNGQPALIEVGRDVTYIKKVTKTVDSETNTSNYDIETANVLSGVGLAITAVIKTDNEIVMNLVPITSELVGNIEYRTFGEAEVGLPIVNKREMSTTVKIKNGSMLVVGGLISETESRSGDSIFGTENIPYLKYLFGYEEKQKTKRELIILLRPRII